ncbi:esterase/lipase family protein [Rubrivirga sp.]|uniref:esterase/lipase family protein n=1 Tax=Rubrivirga sp. TaxID=1885344 RepID=UPI003B52310B
MSVPHLRGAARLASDAVTGVTDVVEAAHATIASPRGRPRRARGIAGVVYRMVRAVTRGVARLLDGGLAVAERSATPSAPRSSAAHDAAVAALNGVVGDWLAAEGNPLATVAEIRLDGRALDLTTLTDPSGVLLVHVHGLCMHDGQWGDAAHDPRAVLAEALGATALAVRYNSGRHVSESGRDLAGLLDRVVAGWPVPVRRLVLVGHSMGGLVLRSALHLGAEAGHGWPSRDVSLVTLGTPHHGAPLERIGNVADAMLEATRWSAPYARVGQVRSAGVTDLRRGNLSDADWTGRDRFARGPDARQIVPLSVATYFVAATTGDGRGGVRDQTLGDGLVPLDSALGRHRDPARDLGVPADRTRVFSRMTHFELLRRPEVTDQLVAWLAPDGPDIDAPARTRARNER